MSGIKETATFQTRQIRSAEILSFFFFLTHLIYIYKRWRPRILLRRDRCCFLYFEAMHFRTGTLKDQFFSYAGK